MSDAIAKEAGRRACNTALKDPAGARRIVNPIPGTQAQALRCQVERGADLFASHHQRGDIGRGGAGVDGGGGDGGVLHRDLAGGNLLAKALTSAAIGGNGVLGRT